MIIYRTLNFFESIVILTLSICLLTEQQQQQQQQSSSQLFRILTSLKPLRPQICQFKFENCIQDSSYADQLDTDCDIYSRLRDCFRSLFDESQCLSSQLKHQYKQAKKNEYEACGVTPSYESSHSFWYTSLSTKLQITWQTILLLFFLVIHRSLI